MTWRQVLLTVGSGEELMIGPTLGVMVALESAILRK